MQSSMQGYQDTNTIDSHPRAKVIIYFVKHTDLGVEPLISSIFLKWTDIVGITPFIVLMFFAGVGLIRLIVFFA
ncbi:hypothetical protein PbJCM17693_21220 [Paenibacillus macerans]|nr:hypothetical protein PbJCM17693_21220 [Paenibacillus macerans]